MTTRRRGSRVGAALHRLVYRLSGGRIGHHLADGSDVLLLTTTDGARPQTTPVRYVRDCESWLVVPEDELLSGLECGDDVVVQVGPSRFDATAVVVEGDALDQLWWTVSRRYPDLATDGDAGGSRVPVVVLRARSRDTAGVPSADQLLGI